jgi:hypothetical protein
MKTRKVLEGSWKPTGVAAIALAATQLPGIHDAVSTAVQAHPHMGIALGLAGFILGHILPSPTGR